MFFGTDPKNLEFKGLIKSIFGERQHDIFVLSSTPANSVSQSLLNDIHQDIRILKYPENRHDLALDFLVRLEPRKSNESDNYKVFSTFNRKEYLDTQRRLEKEASSIRYCTPKFTNVFGGNAYIRDASAKFAKTVYDELEKHGDKKPVHMSRDAFAKKVYDGMKGRRDNILESIKQRRIKSIYILFKDEPDDKDLKRINFTIKLCRKNMVNLQIRQIDWDGYECLNKDADPFKDPSMALIIGNSDAKFNLGLCHASQATISGKDPVKSYVRFQWVHTDTIFSQNRLSWFNRAWELADEYIIK